MKLLQGIKDNDLLKDLYFFCQNMRSIYYFKGVEEDEEDVIVEVDKSIEKKYQPDVKKFNLLLQNYNSICNLSLQTTPELQKINMFLLLL